MGSAEHIAIQREVGRAGGLMKIHITATAMICGQMKHGLDVTDSGARRAFRCQIAFEERNALVYDMVFDVGDAATTEVVHDTDLRPPLDERVH